MFVPGSLLPETATNKRHLVARPGECNHFLVYMFHTEGEFIEVKSPIDSFKEHWAQQPGPGNFLRQRNVILQNPDLVQYAEWSGVKGWIQPLVFALLGLVVAAFVLSALSWWMSHDRGKQADEITAIQAELQSEVNTSEGEIAAAQFQLTRVKRSRNFSGFTVASSVNLTKEAAVSQLNALMEEARKGQEESKARADMKIQNVRARQDALALAASGTPIIFSLALLFAAPLLRKAMQKQYPRSALVARADNFYLYFLVSRGLWLNCALVVILNLAFSSAYGLRGMLESIGPVGQGLFWIAVYALLLFWFVIVSKDLHKSMQLPRMAAYASPDNKVLLSMHNSFWMVFVPFEALVLVLCGAVYLLERPWIG